MGNDRSYLTKSSQCHAVAVLQTKYRRRTKMLDKTINISLICIDNMVYYREIEAKERQHRALMELEVEAIGHSDTKQLNVDWVKIKRTASPVFGVSKRNRLQGQMRESTKGNPKIISTDGGHTKAKRCATTRADTMSGIHDTDPGVPLPGVAPPCCAIANRSLPLSLALV